MAVPPPVIAASRAAGAAPGRPFDAVALGIVALGLATLWLPTFWDLNFGASAQDAQGHELIILAVSAWLL